MNAMEHFNVRVTRFRKCIQLDQYVYTVNLLKKFEYDQCVYTVNTLGSAHKVLKSPLLPSHAVDRIERVEPELLDADQTYVNNFPYWSLLGALLYCLRTSYH